MVPLLPRLHRPWCGSSGARRLTAVLQHTALTALTALALAAPGCVILGCVAETPFVTVTEGGVVGLGMAVTSGPEVDADHDVIDSVPFVFVTETTRYFPASVATGV